MENINIWFGWVIILISLTIWSVIWKGIALWKAGKNNDLPWFVVMFLLNTAGILEIIYIYAISKKNKPKEELPKI